MAPSRWLISCVLVCASSGCAVKTSPSDLEAMRQVNSPEPFVGPTRPHLAEFARMLKAYLTGVEQDVLVEIDLFHNDGLARELPTDIGGCAREAVDAIGLRSVRAWPTWLVLPSAPSAMGFRPAEPSKLTPTYRLIGSISASNSLESSRNIRAAAARDKKPIGDAELSFEDLLGVTTITLQVALEDSGGVAVPGGTTTFIVTVERRERSRTASIYVAGSGIGGGQRLVVAQNAYAAACDAAAVAIVQLIGRATSVPYYRVAPAIFGEDRDLDVRKWNSLHRMAMQEIEQHIKQLLFAQGHRINLASPLLAPEDRVLVRGLMQAQSLKSDDREALIQFAYSIWRGLDYKGGADRVEAQLAANQRQARERERATALAASVPAPPPGFTPTSFGWSDADRVAMVDLSRIVSVEARRQIVAVLRRCNGCRDVVANENTTRVAIRLTTNPVEVREQLRLSGLRLQYAWRDQNQKELIVAPFGSIISK